LLNSCLKAQPQTQQPTVRPWRNFVARYRTKGETRLFADCVPSWQCLAAHRCSNWSPHHVIWPGKIQFDHSPYSPDLAPSDFHLFLHLKKCLAGQPFLNIDGVKEAAKKWLSSQAAMFYEKGIQKLVPRYDKYLNNGGNYVEK
jgi:hypothetical protein